MSPGRWALGGALLVLAGALLLHLQEPNPQPVPVLVERTPVPLDAPVRAAVAPSLPAPVQSQPGPSPVARPAPVSESRLVRPYIDYSQVSDGSLPSLPPPMAGMTSEAAERYRTLLRSRETRALRQEFRSEKRRLKHAYKARREQGLTGGGEKPWKALERADEMRMAELKKESR